MVGHFYSKAKRTGLFFISVVFLASCKIGTSSLPSAKEVAENPPIAPLGHRDISDPQDGYFHAPSGVQSGDFYFAKGGSSREKNLQRLQSPSRISFYEKDRVNGLAIGYGFCSYNERNAQVSLIQVPSESWICFLFKDQSDAQAGYLAAKAPLWPVDTVVCINCAPRPVGFLDRLCPGYYQSWLSPETWKDPTYPGDITKFADDGNCVYNKPWFRVKTN